MGLFDINGTASPNASTSSPLFEVSSSTANSSNGELKEPLLVTYKSIKYLIATLGFVICAIAVMGNCCVVYLVASKRRMRNVTNYFIASLAVSDVMIAVVCIPFSFMANVLFDEWPFGSFLCPILPYFQAAVVFQNAYTLLAMSLERYVAIVHPFVRRLGKRRCLQIVVLCWVLAFLTPIPAAVTSKLSFHLDHENTTTGAWLCTETWDSIRQRFAYSVTILILQFFLPLMALVYTYAKIVHVIWLKDMPALGELLNHNKETKEVKVKEADPRKKIIKMMITVVGIYILGWLPLHMLTIVTDVDNSLYDWHYMQLTWTSFQLLALSTCVYNPFIYWWMNPKFKEGYIMLYQKVKARLLCRRMDDAFLDLGTSVGSSKRFFSTRHTVTSGGGSRRQSNSTQVESYSCDGNGTAMEKFLLKDQHSPNRDSEYSPPLSNISEALENGHKL